MARKKKTINVKEKEYYQYAQDVLDGKLVAGELVRLACKRFINDLERPDLEFRAEIVDRFITFCSLLKHFKGKSAGKSFILEPWEQFIAANIIGFYYKNTDDRKYTNSLICVSRKNGKTALAALFCLWFLIGDGESGAEVDLAANSRQQAQISYKFVQNFAKQLDPSGKELKILRNGIRLELNDSNLNVFASDSTKLDGFNASFALIDEYHAAKDSRLYDVLKSSQGDRKNPHLMVISTVGFSITSPFKKLYDTDAEILHGIKQDDSTFAMIFALDDCDDWRDEKVWRKIAPNLGVTVTVKGLREQVVQAQNNVSAETGILVKNFNIWQQVTNIWIPDSYVNHCFKKISYTDFNEDTSLCYVGTDLAAVGDMTAVSCLFTKDGDDKIYFITEYFLPETALTESPNRELYKQWKRQGLLTITEGNVTDYTYITRMMLKRNSHIPIRKVAYDSWNSTQWAIEATEQGLPLEPYSQSIGNFNRPTRELERLIRSQKVVFQTNEITRWMFRNVLLKHDHNDNVKPTKGGTGNQKIDGVIAILEALGIYLLEPRYSGEIFTV